MAQVKAKFVAPASAEHPQPQQLTRPHRVSSGNFGHVKQTSHQTSGALSHRQMQLEPIQSSSSASKMNKPESNVPQRHHISLQKLMQQENAKKRERSSHDAI